MSFTGTPLAQTRRLDRDTFLGKPTANTHHNLARTVLKPSFPVGVTTSTPTTTTTTTDARSSTSNDNENSEPALARFARQKQREAELNPTKWSVKDTTVNIASAFAQAAATPDMASSTNIYSNPNAGWAASTSRTASTAHIPRSTSVEYEQQAQATREKRLAPPSSRFPGRGALASKPPSKSRSLQHVPDSEGEEQVPPNRGSRRAPSPFGQILDAARDAINPAELFLRPKKASAPEADQSRSFEQQQPSRAANDSSYDYGAEESYMQKSSQQQQQRAGAERNGTANGKLKKGGISVDHAEWKPPASDDDEESDEDEEPEKRQRRKKNLAISRLTNLPSIADSKSAKKRRKKGSKGASGGVGEEDDGAASDENTDISVSMDASQLPAFRTSAAPRSRRSAEPLAPEPTVDYSMLSMDAVEAGLQSIPEIPEEDAAPTTAKPTPVATPAPASASAPQKPPVATRTRTRRSSRATTPVRSQPRFSIGALLGTFIHYCVNGGKGAVLCVLQVLAAVSFMLGRVMGTIFDVVLNQPAKWISGPRSGLVASFARYLVLGLSLTTAWWLLQNSSIVSRISDLRPWGRGAVPDPVYVPGPPVANIDELVQRLAQIEARLSDLSQDTTVLKVKTEDTTKSYGDVVQRLGSVEGRIVVEAKRISETETRERESIGKSVGEVKREVEELHAQMEARAKELERERVVREKKEWEERAERERERKEREKEQRAREEMMMREREREREQHQRQQKPAGDVKVSDEEARALVKALEARVGTVEGGVKEALELGKKLASVPPPSAIPAPPAPSHGAAWWSKIVSKSGNQEGLKITTPDGQDVTGLISHLVDSAVSLQSKDTLAKPDFALYSAGGRVVPSLTSPTFEMKPASMRGVVLGMLTGNGGGIGHPPVTAIEPSVHAGRCWPLAGVRGQLGIALAMPVFIDEISVDHVAREVAFDMRTAPREMEVWGLVEGQDNIDKLNAWRAGKIAKERAEREGRGEVLGAGWEEEELGRMREGYPASLPRNPEYVRVAKFVYDVRGERSVQTFRVLEEVKEMGVDFGVVVGRVLSNWGHEAYTCLYRLRVHGRRVGEVPVPVGGEEDEVRGQ